jgi:hypothetical protein|eukprot:176508-Prymnesium_polylepis.2
MEEADEVTNGVVYCGPVTINSTTMHKYIPRETSIASGKKRKHEEISLIPSKAASLSAEAILESFLSDVHKDSLQSLCKDKEIPVSGSKLDRSPDHEVHVHVSEIGSAPTETTHRQTV